MQFIKNGGDNEAPGLDEWLNKSADYTFIG